MASEISKLLQSGLAPALKERGYAKSGATWRKKNDEIIRVFNLQGSHWGPVFYVNLGIYFRALGDRDRPSESHCHIRTRLGKLVPDRHRLNSLLDFEMPFEEYARIQEIMSLVVQYGLPWLDKLSTIEGARNFCLSENCDSYWITIKAREFLMKSGET